MKTIEIQGKLRKELGKKATKQIRKAGEVPCVIYGGEKNVHFSANVSEFKTLIYTPESYLLNLNIDGTVIPAIMQDSQYHPVNDEILHVDFLQISEDKKVEIAIPVATHGFAVGVQDGGKLQILNRKLRVSAFAKDLPEILNIDITELTLGKSIKISELSFENLELLDPKNSVVCSVKLTRAAKGDMEGEGEEGEGEEGEGEETTTEE